MGFEQLSLGLHGRWIAGLGSSGWLAFSVLGLGPARKILGRSSSGACPVHSLRKHVLRRLILSLLLLACAHGREAERLGQLTHADVHALQGRQRHTLHFQRLNRGGQCAAVLLQPELHGLELGDALVHLLNADRRSHPLRRFAQRVGASTSALHQTLQKIKAGDELAKVKIRCVRHEIHSP